MDNRKKIIITTLIVATLILLAFIIWLLFSPKNINNFNNGDTNSGSKTITSGMAQSVLPLSSPERIAEEKRYPLGLRQLAISFAERYGSYSTDQKFKNLDDLKPFMSTKMQKTVDDFMLAERNATSTLESFQGLTTKGLSADLISLETSGAVIVVQTQRTISSDSGLEPVVSYRNLKLSFIKTGNEWQVDEAVWQ